MAKRGRPVQSQIRQNIVEILALLNRGHGYQISKIYSDIFPPVTQRSIYYHLKKGVITKEIVLDKIEEEKGNFSWGGQAEKIYYKLGEKAEPKGDLRVKSYFEQKLKKK